MEDHELKIMRAEQADQLLNHPLFKQAFDETRNGIKNTWAALPENESRTEFAHDLHRMVRALDRVERCLRSHITTGKLAAQELEGRKNLFGRRR